jgi:hypothetical protein
MELAMLKMYFENREMSFNTTTTDNPISARINSSPIKNTLTSSLTTGSPSKKQKTQYDLMEERIEKLKNYQQYYT